MTTPLLPRLYVLLACALFLLLLPTTGTTVRAFAPSTTTQQGRVPFRWEHAEHVKKSSHQKKLLSSSNDDDFEYARVRRDRRSGSRSEMEDDNQIQVDEDDRTDYYSQTAGKSFDDDIGEDWEYLDEDDEEEYDMFENVLIPNPLLDSIDPDGAAERFPELARDPRFWFDMVLFIAFLDFLSYAGPRDPFPDLPMYFPGV
jgi:hypothetical protein